MIRNTLKLDSIHRDNIKPLSTCAAAGPHGPPCTYITRTQCLFKNCVSQTISGKMSSAYELTEKYDCNMKKENKPNNPPEAGYILFSGATPTFNLVFTEGCFKRLTV